MSLSSQITSLGSEIRKKTYSESRIQGVKKAPDPGSATQHYLEQGERVLFFLFSWLVCGVLTT
jgi:hypothetical protein